MIYHIPAGTSIRRMKSPTSDPISVETSKEVWYTDKDLVKIEQERESLRFDTAYRSIYIFLLPLNAKPWWSFSVYEDAIHHIHFIGTTTSGARNEQELLQDLKSGKINPFKTTPESQKTDSTVTPEERIVGRPLTARERAEIREQWDKEDDEELLNFPIAIKYTKHKTVQPMGFHPKDFRKTWVNPLLRPIFPILPKDLLPKEERPTDSAKAVAWDIDREILSSLTNGLWRLEVRGGAVFYLDYKHSKGK